MNQLRETLPSRWIQHYGTPWRDITIDAEIITPNADALPVVLLAGGAVPPVLTAVEAGWDEIEYRGPYDLLLSRRVPEYPKKVNGKRVGAPVSEGSWCSGFQPENQYVPMDEIRLGEITSRVRDSIAALGYAPDDFETENPVRIWTHHVYEAGTRKDLLPGYLCMELCPKAAGIPVFSHIWHAVASRHGDSRSDEFTLTPTSSVCYDGYLGDLAHIYVTPLRIVQTPAEDVPLCPFDKVIDTVEAEINAGHIRKIHEIELGYVLYNEPGVYRPQSSGGKSTDSPAYQAYQNTRYYAKPMWQVNCLCAQSPTAELRKADDERSSLDYRQLLIDVQTAELIQPTNAKDRCAFNGFLPWNSTP